ncbi:hypothetical protein Mpsy_1942 [Methanolobus psychrophilus R15]|nr:hypothetical protein Mpsy_1942 [Methanolobus psychrophilus R15]
MADHEIPVCPYMRTDYSPHQFNKIKLNKYSCLSSTRI